MLIDLYTEEREQERCAIVHELKNKAEKVIRPYMDQIHNLESDISALNRQASDIRSKINKHLVERDDGLKKAKLYTFTHKTCGDALHVKLCNFDQETNNHIREILEGDKKEKRDE
jgi:hypothetical protein